MSTPGTNPFGGSANAPLPGGGGNYLGTDSKGQPARHIVMVEKFEYKAPGFKTPQGAAIENFQVLATDSDNHKVGASYGRFYGFDKLMAKGNCRADVAAFRGVLLGRPPMPAEVTDEMIAAHFGVQGFDLATHDPEVAKLAPAGLRGLVLVAVCYKKDGKDWTHCSFQDLNDKDKLKLKTEQPDLYAQLYPQEQAAG